VKSLDEKYLKLLLISSFNKPNKTKPAGRAKIIRGDAISGCPTLRKVFGSQTSMVFAPLSRKTSSAAVGEVIGLIWVRLSVYIHPNPELNMNSVVASKAAFL